MGIRSRRRSSHVQYLPRKTLARYRRMIETWCSEITAGIPAVMAVPTWVDDPRKSVPKAKARRHLSIYRRERTYWL